MKIIKFLAFVSLNLFINICSQAQADSSENFDLKFVRAKFTDPGHKADVLVVLQLIPKNAEQFPPMFEPGMVFSLDDGPEQIVDAEHREVKVDLQINDKETKDTLLANFVKDHLTKSNTDYLLLAFYMERVSKTGFYKMKITYGMREKNDGKVRRVQRFEFIVEK